MIVWVFSILHSTPPKKNYPFYEQNWFPTKRPIRGSSLFFHINSFVVHDNVVIKMWFQQIPWLVVSNLWKKMKVSWDYYCQYMEKRIMFQTTNHDFNLNTWFCMKAACCRAAHGLEGLSSSGGARCVFAEIAQLHAASSLDSHQSGAIFQENHRTSSRNAGFSMVFYDFPDLLVSL